MMPHPVVVHYATALAHLEDERLHGDGAGLRAALGSLCAALTELAADNEFWASLTEYLAEVDVHAEFQAIVADLDEFMEHEQPYVLADCDGDAGLANRLLDDLGTIVMANRFHYQDVAAIAVSTEHIAQLICAQEAQLQHHNGWRHRLRGTVLARAIVPLVGALAIGLIDLVVINVEPVVGSQSLVASVVAASTTLFDAYVAIAQND